jgi:hypothetical protein
VENNYLTTLRQIGKKMKNSKRNLHEIVIDALQFYSYQANVDSVSFRKKVADKVYEDFCTEFYPPEPTTADDENKVYISDINREIANEANKARP